MRQLGKCNGAPQIQSEICKRDHRKDPSRLDQINYNLLIPYTIDKMIKGRDLLNSLKDLLGETIDQLTF